jgi:hypothetical protein
MVNLSFRTEEAIKTSLDKGTEEDIKTSLDKETLKK